MDVCEEAVNVENLVASKSMHPLRRRDPWLVFLVVVVVIFVLTVLLHHGPYLLRITAA
jgi:nitrate reductase NapE component